MKDYAIPLKRQFIASVPNMNKGEMTIGFLLRYVWAVMMDKPTVRIRPNAIQ